MSSEDRKSTAGSSVSFEYLLGIFESTDWETDRQRSFGLKLPCWDRTMLSEEERSTLANGKDFMETFRELEDSCVQTPTTSQSIKLIFLGRHGQGKHNALAAKYGGDYILAGSEGDPETDPSLTGTGLDQAKSNARSILEEIDKGTPIPTVFKSGPLSRQIETAETTWGQVMSQGDGSHSISIDEGFREKMHAWLWNKRSRLSALKEKFTNISVPRGMTEDDEQFARFSRQQPESRQQVDARTKLSGENTILENPTDSVLSITSSAEALVSIEKALGISHGRELGTAELTKKAWVEGQIKPVLCKVTIRSTGDGN